MLNYMDGMIKVVHNIFLTAVQKPLNKIDFIRPEKWHTFSVWNKKKQRPHMQIFYRQFATKITAALLVLLCIHPALNAQQTLQGIVRIKVTEGLAEQLEVRSISRNASGEVVTGIAALDQMNKEFMVRSFNRVFPTAGKNEARHRKYGLHLWYEVRPDKAIPVSQVLQSYQSEKQILRAEPVYEKTIIGSRSGNFGPKVNEASSSGTYSLPDASNDPLLIDQWHYHNTGQTGGKLGADIRLLDAWKMETGNREVIIAVNDGGIQTDHPDLAPNLWVNTGEIAGNGVDDDRNGYVDDLHGYGFVNNSGQIIPDNHGTHVAGTIAAVNNNGQGVAGVAGGSGNGDGVRLMSCAVFNGNDADGFAQAYVYSADQGAVISQNSWGYTMPGVFEQVVLDAIDYFIAEAGKDENGRQTGPMNGGLVIFSAGNYNSEENYYPAFYAPVLAVASSTHTDVKAQYSNYGSWIDITAPGGETYQALEQGVMSTLAQGKYGFFMGTSMACPHVSGVAGLVLSRYAKDGMHPENLRERLVRSIDPIGAANPTFAGKLGTGRLNAARALVNTDAEPPHRVTDLAVAGKDIGEIKLTWTSPSDVGGFLARYDLRYSTSAIREDNFEQAVATDYLPPPQAPGSKETFAVKNLPGGVRYYFALRSVDFEGNISSVSNVVSSVAALTPAIAVSPSSLTEKLKTAESSSRTFTISNTGQGPLTFDLSTTEEKTFSSIDPLRGEILPGKGATITLSLNATGIYSGTYRQNIVINSNDPKKNEVILPLTLEVVNNGAPIAGLSPTSLDFKGARVGTIVNRYITLSNGGSDNLRVTQVQSANTDFKVDAALPLEIEPFTDKAIRITFAPSATGMISGKVVLYTNDPQNGTLTVNVQGEGLNQSPVVVTPNTIRETIAQGSTGRRSLTLQNNGSQDRTFRMEVRNSRLEDAEGSVYTRTTAGGRLASGNDSLRVRQQKMREQHKVRLAAKSTEENALAKVVGPAAENRKSKNAQGRVSQNADAEIRQYTTGFENFNLGPMGEQQGWYSTPGWTIAANRPYSGTQHLRGISKPSGAGEQYALSPYLFEGEEYYYPRYTTAAMRLNLDDAQGTSWEIVPQDPLSYIATRIRFNADGTIEAMVIDNDYNFLWKKVPVNTPSGYFDLAVEYNNWGSDTSGFPTYYLFINNQHVFSGTGLGSGIGQVAVVTPMETTGPVLDIDDFKLIGGEYVPSFIFPEPQEGIVPAGQSVNIDVALDATVMKYGTYAADLVVHLDEVDSLLVPVTLEVVGEASLLRDVHAINMELNKGESGSRKITLTNIGGREVAFDLALETELPGLTFKPASGTVAVREDRIINVEFTGNPGVYRSTMILTADIEDYRVEIPVQVIVFDTGGAFVAPNEVAFDIRAGEISAHTFEIRNEGTNPVSYHSDVDGDDQSWISLDPDHATISETSSVATLTFDAREVSPGTRSSWVIFTTNDPDKRTHRMNINLNILPDTVQAGKIIHEMWTGIPGKIVSAIPLNTSPTSTTLLTRLETQPDAGDNYGSRIRGYVRAPMTGNYIFWIASNDNSELWLSTDENEENKTKVASVTGYTHPGQWSKYPSQRSAEVSLRADQKYYIEVLHKEGTGTDHLAVGWELPDGSLERPVPGMRLIPYGQKDNNEPPTVKILSPAEGQTFSAPATINIEALAEDADRDIVKVDFYQGTTKLGTDIEAPYQYSWKNVAVGHYTLRVTATDQKGKADTAMVNVTVSEQGPCTSAGSIFREQWNDVTGTMISSIPLDAAPASIETLTAFESSANISDNYGARIRGFICVPLTGEYTFWIASNDKSELWLSADASPQNKTMIAHVERYTNIRQWTKSPGQQSSPVALIAGQKYYIEALHKEGVGSDHLAVGWQLPDGTFERPMPGIRLMPFENTGNHAPQVTLTQPADEGKFTAPATVSITADAWDEDGTITRVIFYNGTAKLGEDLSAPYTFSWPNVPAGNYMLTAVATDNAGLSTTSSPVGISIEASGCTASGYISREYWTGISGGAVADIPISTIPDGEEELPIFESPSNLGSHYGARMRGYICPPVSGAYTFWIASNDHSELWLSTDDDPVNKVRIAFVQGATGVRQWDKFTSQVSIAIPLTKGKPYYIEALHKQGVGGDHLAVGWQLPDGTMERPISGSRLSPYNSAHVGFAEAAAPVSGEENTGGVQVFPNPVRGESLNIVLENMPEGPRIMEITILQQNGMLQYREKIACASDCSTAVTVTDHLPVPGLYFLEIKIGERVYMRKLVVQ